MINIAILGSTGSIGITTLNIIRQNKNIFNVELLTANSNAKLLYTQAKEFRAKYVIIANKKSNFKWIEKLKKK